MEVKIHLTKKQKELLEPLMEECELAYSKGAPGMLILQIEDNLKEARGIAVPEDQSIRIISIIKELWE